VAVVGPLIPTTLFRHQGNFLGGTQLAIRRLPKQLAPQGAGLVRGKVVPQSGIHVTCQVPGNRNNIATLRLQLSPQAVPACLRNAANNQGMPGMEVFEE